MLLVLQYQEAQALQRKVLPEVGVPDGMGFTVVPFGQGFKDMSPPTKELMKLTLEQRIAHGGHPVLRWMMDNTNLNIKSHLRSNLWQ